MVDSLAISVFMDGRNPESSLSTYLTIIFMPFLM